MTTYSIPDMSCGHCKATVQKALAPFDASAKVDPASKTAIVNSPAAQADILQALNAVGYPAKVMA